jgi:hypothetical protein
VFRIACVLALLGGTALAACGGSSRATDAAAQDDAAVAHDGGGQDAVAQDAVGHDTRAEDGPGGDALRLMDGPLPTDGPECIPAPAPAPSLHNGGMDCLSCHPTFGAAGTIFTDPAGTTTVGAATVRILDADGVTHDGVTCGCGNFLVRDSIAFPATLFVSKCPDTVVMVGEITYGGCNSCHAAGDRVHLP